MTNFHAAILAALSLGLIATGVWAETALAPQPTVQDVVTDQVALQLGRLTIENRTLAVALDGARGRIAELERQLKDAQTKCETCPSR